MTARSPLRASGATDRARLERAVVAHYERQLERHGPTARGMDWKDEMSQRLRFAILCEICDLAGKTVHEVGAGAGHLCDFLQQRGIGAVYSGSDLSPKMVDAARRLHPDVRFEVRNVLADGTPESYDVVLCSGAFHVKLELPDDAWRAFVYEALRGMYRLCRVGIGFNLMSDQVDFRSPSLFYANPGEVLDYCRRELSRHVVLRHDYPLHEYTIHVYRNARAR